MSEPGQRQKKRHGRNPAESTEPEEQAVEVQDASKEVGGPAGPEPTRYGDWEYKGRCIDF